jgi:hypothetical protein
MMAIARVPPCRAIVVRPVISDIAAGSHMKGNARGALLLCGPRLGVCFARAQITSCNHTNNPRIAGANLASKVTCIDND